jgi:hypothetical protein
MPLNNRPRYYWSGERLAVERDRKSRVRGSVDLYRSRDSLLEGHSSASRSDLQRITWGIVYAKESSNLTGRE